MLLRRIVFRLALLASVFQHRPCNSCSRKRYRKRRSAQHWCRKEGAISRRCERGWWRVLRNGYLAHRARLQKRDYRLARGVIGMSHRFNRWVQRDYRVPSERLGVVYHPIEVGGLSDLRPTTPRLIRLLFVGRVSVRKGVELLVQVIPSVLAAHPDVEVGVIGAGSLWSDYETLLSDLPKERCRWLRIRWPSTWLR